MFLMKELLWKHKNQHKQSNNLNRWQLSHRKQMRNTKCKPERELNHFFPQQQQMEQRGTKNNQNNRRKDKGRDQQQWNPERVQQEEQGVKEVDVFVVQQWKELNRQGIELVVLFAEKLFVDRILLFLIFSVTITCYSTWREERNGQKQNNLFIFWCFLCFELQSDHIGRIQVWKVTLFFKWKIFFFEIENELKKKCYPNRVLRLTLRWCWTFFQ